MYRNTTSLLHWSAQSKLAVCDDPLTSRNSMMQPWLHCIWQRCWLQTFSDKVTSAVPEILAQAFSGLQRDVPHCCYTMYSPPSPRHYRAQMRILGWGTEGTGDYHVISFSPQIPDMQGSCCTQSLPSLLHTSPKTIAANGSSREAVYRV